MKNRFGTYDGHSNGCVRCNDYDCIVKTNQNRNTERTKDALDNEVRIDFANKIRNYLCDIENKIVKERNKPQSSADEIRLVSM